MLSNNVLYCCHFHLSFMASDDLCQVCSLWIYISSTIFLAFCSGWYTGCSLLQSLTNVLCFITGVQPLPFRFCDFSESYIFPVCHCVANALCTVYYYIWCSLGLLERWFSTCVKLLKAASFNTTWQYYTSIDQWIAREASEITCIYLH